MKAPTLSTIEAQIDTLHRALQANDPLFLKERLRRAEDLLRESCLYVDGADCRGGDRYVERLVSFVMEGL